MKRSREEERAARFLLVLLAGLGAVATLVLMPFLTGAVFALVVAFLLQGPQEKLTKRLRSRAAAATVLTILVLLAIVAPFVAIVFAVADDAFEVANSVEKAGGLQKTAVDALTRVGVPNETASKVYADSVAKLGELAQANVLPTLAKLASAAANIGVFVFLLYFMLYEGKALARYVGDAMPLPPRRRQHLLSQVGTRVRALFLGTFLVALVQGSIATLGWWILGFPSPLFWGFVMTILAVIPAVGPIIVMLPAGVIAIAQGNVWPGIGLIAYGLIVVGFSDNLVRPFVVGRGSGVHPVLVLLGTLGGLILFGTTGFILGPLVLSMVEPVLGEWEIVRDSMKDGGQAEGHTSGHHAHGAHGPE